MSASTEVMVRDPANPKALFDAARVAARSTGAWKLHNGRGFKDTHMYWADGKDATVSVHFPPAGGLYVPDPECDFPDGYALIMFGTGYDRGEEATRAHHVVIVRRLFEWLDSGSIRMSWRFEEDDWVHGAPALAGRRR